MKSTFALLISIFIACLPSCAPTVAKPGDIKLEDAMASVGRGFVAMREAQGHLRTGLIASDAQITFNISAKGTNGTHLYLEATPTISTAPVKIGADRTTNYEGSRSNQITINFKNVMLADPNKTLIKNAKSITELAGVIRNESNIDARSNTHGSVNLTVQNPLPQDKPSGFFGLFSFLKRKSQPPSQAPAPLPQPPHNDPLGPIGNLGPLDFRANKDDALRRGQL